MGLNSSRTPVLITTEDQTPADLIVSKKEVSQDYSHLVVRSHLQPERLEKQSQQQLQHPERENSVHVNSPSTLLSSPIGDDKSDVSHDYCTEAIPSTINVISHGDVLNYQTFGPTTSYQEKTDFNHEIIDRLLDLELPLSPSPKVITDRFGVDELNKLICSDSVPVVLCQATLSGFASKGRSQIFMSLFQAAINVQHEHIHDLIKEMKCQGLSCFHFDIMGSFPFDDPMMWMCGTKRSSTTLSLMSSIVRLYATRKVKIENVAFDDCVSNEVISDDFAHKHINWLYKEVLRNLRELKSQPNKMSYLQSGICILNIFNVGYSKAAYEFLPFLTQHCSKLLQLVFLDIDHDLYHLQHPLELEDMDNIPVNHLVRSRIKHLSHYAFAGHQKSRQCPVIIGLTERQSDSFSKEILDLQKLQKDMNIEDMTSPLLFSPGLEDIIRKQLEQVTIKELKFFDSIPLKWVFLRSAIQVQYPLPMLMKKSDIINLVASVVVMDNNEIEMFLKTFTSFGSLFYASDIPSLREIVITDIERFVTCLDKVYNHQDNTSSDHGLIAEDTIKNLINEDLKLFMAVVTSFQLFLL